MTRKLSAISQAGPLAPAGMNKVALPALGSGLPDAAWKPCVCQLANELRSDAKLKDSGMMISTPQGKLEIQPDLCMKLAIEASTSIFEAQMSAGPEPS